MWYAECIREMRNTCIYFYCENLRGRDHFAGLGIDVTIML
jgi:hypothetical protein